MPLTPGRTFIYAGDVNMYWAPLGTKLPSFDVAFNGSWPAGWKEIYDTTGAIAIRPRNPREEVSGEFHQRLGSIQAGSGGGGGRGGGGGGGGAGGRGGAGGAGGGPGVSIAFEVLTPEYDFWRNMNSFSKTVVAAVAAQRTYTVTAPASANGNLSVVLNGGTPVSIAVLSADATTAIATKIAAGTYVGWSATASGSTVTFTAAAPGLKTGTFSVAPAGTGVVGTFASLVAGHYGLTTSYVDSDAEHHIMFGCEFVPQAGSSQSGFWTEEHLMRAFGMECENVGQPEDLWGRSGRGSILTPNVQLECIPGTIDPTLLAGTGMELSADPEGRFFYADTPLTAVA